MCSFLSNQIENKNVKYTIITILFSITMKAAPNYNYKYNSLLFYLNIQMRR